MAMKSVAFIGIVLVVAFVGVGTSEAQLLNGLIGLIRIQGTVFCTPNGNMGVNGTSTPVFSNANVQLRCGVGNVVSSVTTNVGGVFTILVEPLQLLLSSLLNNCNVVVPSPLSNCDSSLPAVGALLSPLQFIGNTLSGLLNISNLIPSGFSFLPSLV